MTLIPSLGKTKFLRDDWGDIVYETDSAGNKTPVLNPDYDPTVEYISRIDRPEWEHVGLLGKVVMRDDGSCEVGGYAFPNADGIACGRPFDGGYPVLKRISEDKVLVFITGTKFLATSPKYDDGGGGEEWENPEFPELPIY